MPLPSLDFATLRAQTLGVDTPLATPFGERLMVYADFTASGRCLRFVEDYLADLARLYANSSHRGRCDGPRDDAPPPRGRSRHQARRQRRAERPDYRVRYGLDGRHRQAPADPRDHAPARHAPPRRQPPPRALRLRGCRGIWRDAACAAARRLRRPLRAPLERGDVARGARDRRRDPARRRWRRGPGPPRRTLARRAVAGAPAHRLVLGRVERDGDADAGPRGRPAAPPTTTPSPASTSPRARRTSRST